MHLIGGTAPLRRAAIALFALVLAVSLQQPVAAWTSTSNWDISDLYHNAAAGADWIRYGGRRRRMTGTTVFA